MKPEIDRGNDEEHVLIDMHVHTNYSSDSKSALKDIFKTLKKKGIHGIAVTDHNEIDGAIEAYKLGSETGMIVIHGVEISSTDGHILAYGVEEKIPDRMTPQETLEAIKAIGGVGVAAHPYRRFSGLGAANVKKNKFAAVETLNSRSIEKDNIRAMKLASQLKLPQTGGSDAHELKYLGNSCTVFPYGISTEEECLEAMRKGKIRPSGRSIEMAELVRYYLSIGTKWAKRGFKRI